MLRAGARGTRGFRFCLVGFALSATPAGAGDDPSFLSELRLGLFDQSIDGAVSETGVAVNAEALFQPLPWSSGFLALDRVIRPRPHIGATINAGGDTSLAYAGLSWTIPLYRDWLFAEASVGGALHNGPLDEPHIASYGCSWAFRETLSLGFNITEAWSILGTFEHMSNADFCDRNRFKHESSRSFGLCGKHGADRLGRAQSELEPGVGSRGLTQAFPGATCSIHTD